MTAKAHRTLTQPSNRYTPLMKPTILAPAMAALLAFGAAAPALADGHMEDAETKAEALTIDSPIEQLMADEQAKAIVTKHFDGQDVSEHPMYDQFKAMSLKDVAPFSQGMITDEMLVKIDADLAQIGTDAAQ